MSSLRSRSLAVSLATTAVDAGLFALCTLALASSALLWARWLCGAIGAVCNFALNRVWAFRSRHDAAWGQLWKYGVTAAMSVTLATLVWWGLRFLTGWDPRVLHLMSLGLVWLVVSYPLLRRWVFRQRRLEQSPV